MSRSDLVRSGFLFLAILVDMIAFLDQQAGMEQPRHPTPSFFGRTIKKAKSNQRKSKKP